MGFKDEVSEHEDEWNDAQANPRPAGSGIQMLKDGPHQVLITEARIEQINDRWVWLIQFANREGGVRKYGNLDHEVGRRIAAEDAALLGYTGPLSGLEDACESEMFIGLVCDIRKRTKPGAERDFVDVFINNVHEEKSTPEVFGVNENGASAEESYIPAGRVDDDIPF